MGDNKSRGVLHSKSSIFESVAVVRKFRTLILDDNPMEPYIYVTSYLSSSVRRLLAPTGKRSSRLNCYLMATALTSIYTPGADTCT